MASAGAGPQSSRARSGQRRHPCDFRPADVPDDGPAMTPKAEHGVRVRWVAVVLSGPRRSPHAVGTGRRWGASSGQARAVAGPVARPRRDLYVRRRRCRGRGRPRSRRLTPISRTPGDGLAVLSTVEGVEPVIPGACPDLCRRREPVDVPARCSIVGGDSTWLYGVTCGGRGQGSIMLASHGRALDRTVNLTRRRREGRHQRPEARDVCHPEMRRRRWGEDIRALSWLVGAGWRPLRPAWLLHLGAADASGPVAATGRGWRCMDRRRRSRR